MRIHSSSEQGGFTLLELLMSLVIIGILATLFTIAAGIYRSKAYYAISEQMLQQAKVALEAGMAETEGAPSSFMSIWQNTPGPITDFYTENVALGFVNPDNAVIYIDHLDTCSTDWCLVNWIRARHCDSNEYVYWYRFYNGVEMTYRHVNADAMWGC